MAGWKKTRLGELTIHQAATISWLPNIVQGFTTRKGGVSHGAFESLNMSAAIGDVPESVAENRRRVVTALTDSPFTIVSCNQVHGGDVAIIESADQSDTQDADALVTNVPGLLLMLKFADCVPIYLVDPVKHVIGLAHSGWRGTEKNVVGKTVSTMKELYDVEPWRLLAAIGPSISGENYEVGKEVVDALWNIVPLGVSQAFVPRQDLSLTYSLNLRLIVFGQLQAAGVDPDNIAVSDECTYANAEEFFSHRRDGALEKPVGRMAAVLGLKQPQE